MTLTPRNGNWDNPPRRGPPRCGLYLRWIFAGQPAVTRSSQTRPACYIGICGPAHGYLKCSPHSFVVAWLVWWWFMCVSSLFKGAWCEVRQKVQISFYWRNIWAVPKQQSRSGSEGGTISSDYIKQVINKRTISSGVDDKPDRWDMILAYTISLVSLLKIIV